MEAEITELLLKRYKKYNDSAEDFITECVKIEDRDKPGLAIPFELWPEQRETLQTILNNKLNIVMKARQLGLTWLALAYALRRMIFHAGYSVVAISKREDPDTKELVRRLTFILKYMPDWLIREKKEAPRQWDGLTWESTVLSLTIHHPGAEPSTFQSMTAAPDSGRSFTANLIILDEWAFQAWAAEIWKAGFPAVNRPTGGQVIGISTNKRGTLFEFIFREALRGANDFAPIFLGWDVDPRRDEDWYERTKRNMPDHLQEYPRTIEDAFSAGEGTSFPEFSRAIHVCEPFEIPHWWRKWRANDPGYGDPFFWCWYAVSEDGQVYVYKEFTREKTDPKLPYSEQAKRVTRMSKTISEEGQEEQEKYQFTVTGRDAFNRHPETGKSIIDYYREGGVTGCIEPPRGEKTDRIHRKATMHEYLKPYLDENLKDEKHPEGRMTAKLQIFSTCTKLIEDLPLLVNDENDPEKVADCDFDHSYDCLSMGLVAFHAKYSKRKIKEKKSPIAAHKEQLIRRSRHLRRVLS